MTRTLRWAVLLLAPAALSGCGDDASGPEDPPADGEGVLGAWVQADGRTRTYELHEPAGWDGATPLPVVVALHGATQTGRVLRDRIGLDAHADRLGLLAVYPDGVGGTWAVGCGGCFGAESQGVDDLAFLETLLEHLADHLPMDPDRVYLLGFSNGGMLAGHAACRRRPHVAGIGAVSAPLARQAAQGCAPASGLRAAHVHGTADILLPWEGRDATWPWLSIPGTLELWTSASGCAAVAEVTRVRGEDGQAGAVDRLDHPGCTAPGAVAAWRVEAGAHGWFDRTGPDTGVDATAVVMDFLTGS